MFLSQYTNIFLEKMQFYTTFCLFLNIYKMCIFSILSYKWLIDNV